MPGTPDQLLRAGSASVFHLISALSTNANSVKGSPGIVTGYFLVNTAGVYRYVKLYNKASSPNVGTDTPRCVYGIPPASAANSTLDPPVAFETGIGLAVVGGIADSDSTAVGANDVAVTLYFL